MSRSCGRNASTTPIGTGTANTSMSQVSALLLAVGTAGLGAGVATSGPSVNVVVIRSPGGNATGRGLVPSALRSAGAVERRDERKAGHGALEPEVRSTEERRVGQDVE